MSTIQVKDASGTVRSAALVPNTGNTNPAADSMPIVQPDDAAAYRVVDSTLVTSVGQVKSSTDAVKTSADAVKASVDLTKASVDTVNASLNTLNTSVGAVTTAVNTVNTSVGTMSAKLPATLGSKVDAASMAVTNSTEDKAAIGALTETAPASDTASSGLNGRLQRIAQRLTSLIGLFPASLGSKADVASLATTLATEDKALLGGLTEAAPASDTASSGLNGRLQRVAQRLTALIALLPGSLGQKASAASMAVVVASDQSRINVETLGVPGVPRQVTAGTANVNTALTVSCARISVYCRNADCRYVVGSTGQTANNTTSHFIAAGERLDMDVPATPNIAFIRASHSTVDGAIEITELS